MPAGNAYPSGHLVPSPILGLANAPIVETKFLEVAMSLLDFSPRIPLGTFSILLHNTRHESVFCDPEVVRELSRLHENFVIVLADKASNIYTFVCKKYYVSILIEELGLNSLPGNPTYNLTDFSASEVLDNHKSVLTSFGIDPNEDELDLPYIYWIPKMHKNSLPVRPGAPPSLYPFFLQTCLHILSNVFRSTAKQPILEVG